MKKLTAFLLLLALLLTGCMPYEPATTTQAPPPEGETLTVHFIDVGQADCALLECGGEYIIIDGGNVEDSSLVVSYLEKQGVTKLEAVIASHAHEDHAGGLPGVLAVYETEVVYAPTRTYASECFDNFVYYTDQQGLEITIPSPGDVIEFGSATATVLGPVKSYADTNNTSIVLMVQFGDIRFLFTGDMEMQAEGDMLDYWGEGFDWHADVLKVGHHGSETSTGYRFLNEVMPGYGIISVGKNNQYNHPEEPTLSRLNDAGVTVFRTDKLGTVIAESDGKTVRVGCPSGGTPDVPSDSRPAQTKPAPDPSDVAPGQTFIGHRTSKKLHLPTCSTLPKEENRVYFEDYDQAIAEGYVPCSRCLGG